MSVTGIDRDRISRYETKTTRLHWRCVDESATEIIAGLSQVLADEIGTPHGVRIEVRLNILDLDDVDIMIEVTR